MHSLRFSRHVILAAAVATAGVVGSSPRPSAALPLPELAGAKDVAEIVREIDVPPLSPGPRPPDPFDRRPFTAAALHGYESDVPAAAVREPGNADKYALRLAALDALGAVRDVWRKDGLVARTNFSGEVTDGVKKAIAGEQAAPARAILKLEEVINRLEAVRGTRADEPRRWQAHFDYALAVARTRLVFLHEYNLALGRIRTGTLPPTDPDKGPYEYKLTPSAKIQSGDDTQRLADRAERLLDRIKKDHANTPWAVAARRDRAVLPGLEWVAVQVKAK